MGNEQQWLLFANIVLWITFWPRFNFLAMSSFFCPEILKVAKIFSSYSLILFSYATDQFGQQYNNMSYMQIRYCCLVTKSHYEKYFKSFFKKTGKLRIWCGQKLNLTIQLYKNNEAQIGQHFRTIFERTKSSWGLIAEHFSARNLAETRNLT